MGKTLSPWITFCATFLCTCLQFKLNKIQATICLQFRLIAPFLCVVIFQYSTQSKMHKSIRISCKWLEKHKILTYCTRKNRRLFVTLLFLRLIYTTVSDYLLHLRPLWLKEYMYDLFISFLLNLLISSSILSSKSMK